MTVKVLLQLLTYCIFLLLPLYWSESGTIQPVDPLIIIAFILTTLVQRFSTYKLVTYSGSYALLHLQIFYSIVVLLIHALFTLRPELLEHQILQNAYYLILLTFFTSIIFYFFFFFTKQNFYRMMLSCVLLLSILPLLTLVFHGFIGVRARLTFNNPNQLGTFALVSMAIFYYLTAFAKENNLFIYKLASVIIININLIFFAISANRACVGLIALYVFSYPLIYKFKKVPRKPFVILVSFIMLILTLIMVKLLFSHLIAIRKHAALGLTFHDLYIRAFQGLSYNFSSIFHLLFGIGASSYNPSRYHSLEYHNTFINLFCQVGIFGLLIHLLLTLSIARDLYRKGLMYLVPYMCYLMDSLLHYTFRVRVNWLFYAVIIFVLCYKRNIKRSPIYENRWYKTEKNNDNGVPSIY